MPVPSAITDLSTTAGSNSPAGTETPGDGDNYIRALSAFIAELRDGGSITGKLTGIPLGTALLPSYSFTGDANSGMWSPGADTIAVSVGGTEAVRITSAGRLAVNTTTAAAALGVAGSGVFSGSAPFVAFSPNQLGTTPAYVQYTDATKVLEVASTDAAGTLEIKAGGTSTRFAITADGRFYGTALHNNAGAVTGTTNQYIASGTYTPTLTAVDNVAATTARASQWVRVGNVVNVSARFDVTPSANGSPTAVGISLPIPSDLANSWECAGVGGAVSLSVGDGVVGAVHGDTTNNRAQFQYVSDGIVSKPVIVTFQYVVL